MVEAFEAVSGFLGPVRDVVGRRGGEQGDEREAVLVEEEEGLRRSREEVAVVAVF